MEQAVQQEKQLPANAAADPSALQAENHETQYLTFYLGEDMYAIGILNIKEIIEYGQVTEVPLMPDFVRGVINLRGKVVPVIDLQARFNKKISKTNKRTCIVIIELSDEDGTQHSLGVVVDSVSEVLDIPETEIEAAPNFGAKIHPDFIYGMGKVEGKFVILLSIAKVLSLEDMAVLTEAALQS